MTAPAFRCTLPTPHPACAHSAYSLCLILGVQSTSSNLVARGLFAWAVLLLEARRGASAHSESPSFELPSPLLLKRSCYGTWPRFGSAFHQSRQSHLHAGFQPQTLLPVRSCRILDNLFGPLYRIFLTVPQGARRL